MQKDKFLQNKELSTYTMMLVFYLLVDFLAYFSIYNVYIGHFLAIYSIFCLSIYWDFKPKILNSKYRMFLIVVISVFIIQLINEARSILLLDFIGGICFALFLVNGFFKTKIVYACFYVISLFLFYSILKASDLDCIFVDTSRNFISVILLINVSVLYFICIKQNEKISIMPALICFLLSIMGVGRSGILCSSFLLISVLYVRLFNMLNSKSILKLFLLLGAFTILFSLYGNDLISSFYSSDAAIRFEKEGLESDGRNILFVEYIRNINLSTFITGYNYSDNLIFSLYLYNPHNSFIRGHSNMGIFIFVFLFVCLYSFFIYLTKKNFCAVLLLVLLLRGYTDSVFFYGRMDFILYALILFSFFIKKKPNILV